MKLSVLTNLSLYKTKKAMYLITSSSGESILLWSSKYDRDTADYRLDVISKSTSFEYKWMSADKQKQYAQDKLRFDKDEHEVKEVTKSVIEALPRINAYRHSVYGTSNGMHEDLLWVKSFNSFFKIAVDYWFSKSDERYYFGEYLLLEHVDDPAPQIKKHYPPRRGRNSKNHVMKKRFQFKKVEPSWVDEVISEDS